MSRQLVDHIKGQITMAHDWLEGTMSDVTPEVAVWQPPGKAIRISAHYVHVVGLEDFMVAGRFKAEEPLMATRYKDKTGFDTPPPWGPWEEWARSVTIDLPTIKSYAKAVYAATADYLASIDDEALKQPVSFVEGGDPMPLAGALNIVVANVLVHCGEISCIKGLQGKQGYPF